MAEKQTKQQRQFEEMASQKQPGLVKEFCQFLAHNRKWWLIPIILILLLLGLLVVLQATGLAFIYPV